MVSLTKEQIRSIYQELDCGMKCFYNAEKDEIISLPDFENNPFAERDMWNDLINEINVNSSKYTEFKKLPSGKLFELMQDFTESFGNAWLNEHLNEVLNINKPYRNFKFLIDNSTEFRLKWFDYKEQKYCQWIEEQIINTNKRRKQKSSGKKLSKLKTE